MKRIGEQLMAEFIGTMLFVFIGALSVVLYGAVVGGGSATLVAVGLVPIALAHGLGMAILISNTGHISGGHHNPAVTISIWVAGKIDAVRAALYVVAQLAGAAAGAGALALILPKAMWKGANLGTPQVTTQIQHFTSGRAVFLEAVLTFILVYTVFATAVDERGSFKQLSGLPIGLAIAVDILIGGLFTGAAMNPARAFGPALWSGTWTNFFLVYVLGPITGGILAASVYWFAFLRNGPDDLALEEAAAEETGGEEAVLESVLASEADAAVHEAILGSADPATEDRPGGTSDTDGAGDGPPASGAPG